MAGSEFLDKQGLMVLWDRIKELIYECCCGHKDYECINDEVITSECFEKAVLSVTGGKGGDCGFSCNTRISTLYEGSIVVDIYSKATQDNSSRATLIRATIPYQGAPVPVMRITLDGTTYICEATVENGAYRYTDSMSDPTFIVFYAANIWSLAVRSIGTYALKLEDYADEVETTECFDKAVQSVTGYSCGSEFQEVYGDTVTTYQDGDTASSDPIPFDALSSVPTRLLVDFNNKNPQYVAVDAISYGDEGYLFGASFDTSTRTFDFSTYPFAIWLSEVRYPNTQEKYIEGNLVTEEGGDYYLGLKAEMPSATINDCFKAAVNKAIEIDTKLGYIPVYYDNNNDSYYSTMSFDEMNTMFKSDTLYAVKVELNNGYNVFPLVKGRSSTATKAQPRENYLVFQHTQVIYDEAIVETVEFYINIEEETITYHRYTYPTR